MCHFRTELRQERGVAASARLYGIGPFGIPLLSFEEAFGVPLDRSSGRLEDQEFDIAARRPFYRCIFCETPTGGTHLPYCPDCYHKSLDPKGGVPPILKIPGVKDNKDK
jgi:hypothetical protein